MHVWPKTTWRGAVPRKDGSCPYTCFRPKASVVGGLSVNLLTQLSVLYIFTTTGTCTVLEWCWILSEHSAGLSILHCWLCFTWMYGCQSMWAAGCCASRLQVAGRVDKILTHCAIGLLFTKDSQSGRQNNVFTCAKTFCNSGTETVSPNHCQRPNQISVFQPCLLVHWVGLCCVTHDTQLSDGSCMVWCVFFLHRMRQIVNAFMYDRGYCCPACSVIDLKDLLEVHAQ